MRYVILITAIFMIFGCEREPDAATTYGISAHYSGPGHAFANSNGATIYLVVDVVPDKVTEGDVVDVITFDIPTDLSVDAQVSYEACLQTYQEDPGGTNYCSCVLTGDSEDAQLEPRCGCQFMVCLEVPSQTYLDEYYSSDADNARSNCEAKFSTAIPACAL